MEKEIFIIDDDPIYRLIVSKTITHIDSSLRIKEFENGETGLTKLVNLKNSVNEIVVLLDLNMPILNGWEFLDQIEKFNSHELAKLSIYIVSSSTDESDLLKSKNYKFLRGFYSKPLNRADTKTIIGIE